jgi:hypothetical protein
VAVGVHPHNFEGEIRITIDLWKVPLDELSWVLHRFECCSKLPDVAAIGQAAAGLRGVSEALAEDVKAAEIPEHTVHALVRRGSGQGSIATHAP